MKFDEDADISEGLRITQFPAARALTSGSITVINGKFQTLFIFYFKNNFNKIIAFLLAFIIIVFYWVNENNRPENDTNAQRLEYYFGTRWKRQKRQPFRRPWARPFFNVFQSSISCL